MLKNLKVSMKFFILYLSKIKYFFFIAVSSNKHHLKRYQTKRMDSSTVVLLILLATALMAPTRANGNSAFNYSSETVKGSSTTTSHPQTTTEVININKMTLKEVCTRFHIIKALCVCDNTTHPIVQLHCRVKNQNTKPVPIKVVCTSNTRGIIMTSISVVGVIGNSLVIAVTKYRWRTATVSQQLIGALALSDFLFSILTFISEVNNVWSCKWVLGQFMCKLILPSINMTATMALGFILIIAVERFFGVVFPFNQYVTRNRINIMICVNICFSLIVVIPGYAVVTIVHNHTCSEQWSDPNHSLIYSWIFLFVTFLIPIVVISVFYIKMLLSIRASQQQTLSTFNAKQQLQRKQEDQRITAILACLLITFFVLVFPNRIYWILNDHKVLTGLSTDEKSLVMHVSNSAYLLHAAINPLIYSIVDRRFRSILVKLFCRAKQRRSNTINDNCSRGNFNTGMETDTSRI